MIAQNAQNAKKAQFSPLLGPKCLIFTPRKIQNDALGCPSSPIAIDQKSVSCPAPPFLCAPITDTENRRSGSAATPSTETPGAQPAALTPLLHPLPASRCLRFRVRHHSILVASRTVRPQLRQFFGLFRHHPQRARNANRSAPAKASSASSATKHPKRPLTADRERLRADSDRAARSDREAGSDRATQTNRKKRARLGPQAPPERPQRLAATYLQQCLPRHLPRQAI